MRKGILFVLSGPSGSGKTTLAKHIVKNVKNVDFAISYTTREMRNGEKDGIDYKFISEEEFRDMISNNEYAEWAEVHGNLYGTPAKEIETALNSGKDILLDIDIQGSSKIKKSYENSVHIFLIPPNLEELRNRLSKRNTEKIEDLNKRMDTAIKEISQVEDYDYIIMSDDVEKSLQKLESIIESVRTRTLFMKDYVFNLYNISNN